MVNMVFVITAFLY